MKSLLIHGCYDAKTLQTLKKAGASEFAFDLRGRSLNLIPFHELKNLLKLLNTKNIYLTFANERTETIYSYLDLLKDFDHEFILIFRDCQNEEYYQKLNRPFLWMFDPEGNWKTILSSSQIRGVLLPLHWQAHYQGLAGFWKLLEEKNLNVFIHADNFEETASLNLEGEVMLSLDLTGEVESGFRNVDQNKLSEMKIWGRLNANLTGQ